MRWELNRLALAITSMVALAFLVPLIYATGKIAHDRAIGDARQQAAAMVAALAVNSDPQLLTSAVASTVAGSAGRLAVHLPGIAPVGHTHVTGAEVAQANLYRRPVTAKAAGGLVYLQPSVLSDGRSVVIEVFVTDDEMRRGVWPAWFALGALAIVLVAGSVLFADRRFDTPSGKIELYSSTVAGFGYDECPGYPVFLAPRTTAYTINLICNQPSTRLHSQLDMGGFSQSAKRSGREPVRLHPADAAARGIADGDVVRLHNDHGSVLAGAVLSDDCRPGVAQLSTGAWWDASAPEVATCVHGNPNALTADIGTSRLAQGCTGQVSRVEIVRFDGPLPPVKAYDPPVGSYPI